MSRHPALSRHGLVICTKDRPNEVYTCLDSVAKQALPPDLVLVVDSSVASTTRAIVENAMRTWSPGELRYMRSDPGLTRQRNVSLKAVDGLVDVVHFVDDDTVLDRDYVRSLVDVLAIRPDAAGVGGRIINLPPHEPTLARRLILMDSKHEGALLASGVNVLNFSGSVPRETEWLSGCSMSYVLTCINGLCFDEDRAGNGIGEDVDFSRRAAARGTVLWVPAARLEHRQSPVNRDDEKLLARRWVRSRWKLARDGVGCVRRAAVFYAVTGDVSLLLFRAVKSRSWAPVKLARETALGLVDGLRRVPV